MELTALPNWHPAIVHFPIAFVPLALLLDLAGLILRKFDWLDRASAAVWVAAGAMAFVAAETGEAAADGLVGVPATAEPMIGQHSDWGHWVFYGLMTFALLRLGATLWDPKRQRLAARWALLLPELALLAMVIFTADLGGELVYGQGVAVRKAAADLEPEDDMDGVATRPSETPVTESSSTDPAARLTRADDGTVVWRPHSGDISAIGELVELLGDRGSVETMRTEQESEGLAFAIVEGREVWLALPGTFGDVRVEAELDVVDFTGEVGLFHHAQSPEAAGLLVQATDGTQSLWQLRDEQRELNSADKATPDGVFVLAVSSAGKHLKGLVDGATVTHGHTEPGPEGRVGLLLRGQGAVRLVRLSAQPL